MVLYQLEEGKQNTLRIRKVLDIPIRDNLQPEVFLLGFYRNAF